MNYEFLIPVQCFALGRVVRLLVILTADTEDHAQGNGREEHGRTAARNERKGLPGLGTHIDRDHDVQQRLAGDLQGEAQHEQPRESRAATPENLDRAEEYPQVEHQQHDGQQQSVLLDEKGESIVALGVDHLHAHGALPGPLAEDAAVVDGDHRTLGVGEVIDRLFGLRLRPEADPGVEPIAGGPAAPQIELGGQHGCGDGPSQQLEQLAETHAPDEHHDPRRQENEQRRREVGRKNDQTGDQHGHQNGPRALAPDLLLRGRRPGPELPRRHDAYLVDLRLAPGELLGQKKHRSDLQRLGGLELDGAERNPACRAVDRHPDEIDRHGGQHREKVDRPREEVVDPAVDALHHEHGEKAAAEHGELRPQEMGRRTRRMGVVGHLGRGGIDHQHGDGGERGDDDPQHAVTRERPPTVRLGNVVHINADLPNP